MLVINVSDLAGISGNYQYSKGIDHYIQKYKSKWSNKDNKDTRIIDYNKYLSRPTIQSLFKTKNNDFEEWLKKQIKEGKSKDWIIMKIKKVFKLSKSDNFYNNYIIRRCDVNIGCIREGQNIKRFEQMENIKINNVEKKIWFNLFGSYYLLGRIDGVYDNKIIEFKHRTSKRFKGYSSYELCQCLIYSMVLGYNEAWLVEFVNDDYRINKIYLNEHLDLVDEILTELIKFIHNNKFDE